MLHFILMNAYMWFSKKKAGNLKLSMSHKFTCSLWSITVAAAAENEEIERDGFYSLFCVI